MERGGGGVPRPAAAGGGIRRAVPLALLTAVLTTACGGGSGTGGAHPATAVPPPSPTPVSDAELCVRVVAHWSREVLDGGTYGDYQSMGLSNRQYDILREVVAAARPVLRTQGALAAAELIDRRTRARCAGRPPGGDADGGPWR
ncbi:hypothetical protein [Streptomyces sp. NPDC127100]|uniref:hypothetical protein n=1 Tax=Streptomyces sp. NPDC127100 TaxID=3347138 RepID=UPI0036592E0D